MVHMCAWLIAILLFFTPVLLHAQSLQGWGIYFGNTAIPNSKFSIHHELQLRDYKMLGDHQQTLLRFGLQYRANKAINVTMGYAYVYTENEGSPNLPFSENRIYQEALIQHNWDILRFRHRVRTEERFMRSSLRGRARYCLFLDVPLTQSKMMKGGTYLALYNEVFVNVFAGGADAFDRNRLYGGLGYKLLDNLGIQLGYMRQHIGNNAGTNNLLLSLHHQLKL
ncbi:hypothetical protein DI53_1084 [Sphingobacterium deserti]|uniref:DUF2490 domain-containing protein n=2 Tax=Sphingobacterium deserti TaxID=1229276 RepID=A0A0B8T2L8_9SPHI|nr:hypothetical protein DI53_1084 [Sphingobacterium deserti]